jgi:hypothetical protein
MTVYEPTEEPICGQLSDITVDYSLGIPLTKMTGRSPCTRFSRTSPKIRPAFLARSCACIQVLSSDILAMLYTVLKVNRLPS